MRSLGDAVAPRRLGRDFRWLLASSWTSNLGDGIALAAAPLLIASLTSSPILVAAGAMMQFLPWLLFGLLAGAVADHHDRRRLVMLANGLRAVIVLVLVGFLVSGFASVWLVLIVSFLYGTAEVFADSAGSTLLPMLVAPCRPRDRQCPHAGRLPGRQPIGGAAAGRVPVRARIVLAVPAAGAVREPGGPAHLPHRAHAGAAASACRIGVEGARDPRRARMAARQPARCARSSSSSWCST